jgi:thiosulfate/3-mercaptopyruvate sulfurtransferase
MRMVIVDARPRETYLDGHLPGAVHLDPETDLSAPAIDPAAGGRHPLPEPAALAEVFSRAGIGELDFVIAADAGTGWGARCWWLLRHLGHDAAGTIDLRAYRGRLEHGAGGRPDPTQFEARVRTDDLISAEEILERLTDPSLVLFDARSPARWRGDEEPLDPIAGRIPGARNAFFEDAAAADEAISAREPVTYCGSGVTACVVAQRLVLAGRDDVRLYPGSWSEWCRREGYPIEKG